MKKSATRANPTRANNTPTGMLRGDEEFNFEDQEGPLITEEEEQEIRNVASDINEHAFYGKVLRTKKMIENKGTEYQSEKLSPRSQEIAFVMGNIHSSF